MRLVKNRMMRAGSAVLAGMMALSLAACGGGTSSGSSAADKESKTQQGSSAAAEEQQELTIWMGSWWEDQIPVIVEAY